MAFEFLGEIARKAVVEGGSNFLSDLIAKRKDRKDPEVPQQRPMNTQVSGTTMGVNNLKATAAAGDAGDIAPPLGSFNRILALQKRYEEIFRAIDVDEGAVKGAASRTRIA